MITWLYILTMQTLASIKNGLLKCLGMQCNSIYEVDIGEKKSDCDKNKNEKKIFKGFPKSGDPIFNNPDIYAEPSEIIQRNGFVCETHQLNTKDGYILTLLRVPHRKNQEGSKVGETQDKERPVALFVHGILNSGTVWVLNSEENVLLYQLVDRGFDCWILYARGCEYSQKHSTLASNSRQYWNFCFDEMANLDIPLVINYILITSMQQQLYYIAHSMGCTMLFAAVSLHPEISQKIKLMVAFAPAVYLKKARTPFVKLGARIPGIQKMVSSLAHGEFCLRPTIKLVKILAPWVWIWKSRETRDSAWFCMQVADQVNGTDREQINWPFLPVIAGHMPSPTSVRTYAHFLQLHKADEFRYFDYGRSGNMKEYGQPVPPTYDLNKSKFPVAIFCGENDACVHPDDARKLAKDLPNCIMCHQVEWPKFSHSDYLFAKDLDTLVNDHVIKLIESQQSSHCDLD